jgi:aerobic-type carbon monoxide dehydrogenase small subunit (CoxS/CutS family)
MTEHSVTFTLNGERREARVDPRIHLGDFLRHSLGLTGTHLGCEHGVCGACTVIVNGAPVRSCLMLAVQIDSTVVETVESLGKPGALSPLQQAFATNHGLQCGFCTSGMLMTLEAYLRTTPAPTEQDVRIAISGNICRCTGYDGIVQAALDTASAKASRT